MVISKCTQVITILVVVVTTVQCIRTVHVALQHVVLFSASCFRSRSTAQDS